MTRFILRKKRALVNMQKMNWNGDKAVSGIESKLRKITVKKKDG